MSICLEPPLSLVKPSLPKASVSSLQATILCLSPEFSQALRCWLGRAGMAVSTCMCTCVSEYREKDKSAILQILLSPIHCDLSQLQHLLRALVSPGHKIWG